MRRPVTGQVARPQPGWDPAQQRPSGSGGGGPLPMRSGLQGIASCLGLGHLGDTDQPPAEGGSSPVTDWRCGAPTSRDATATRSACAAAWAAALRTLQFRECFGALSWHIHDGHADGIDLSGVRHRRRQLMGLARERRTRPPLGASHRCRQGWRGQCRSGLSAGGHVWSWGRRCWLLRILPTSVGRPAQRESFGGLWLSQAAPPASCLWEQQSGSAIKAWAPGRAAGVFASGGLADPRPLLPAMVCR